MWRDTAQEMFAMLLEGINSLPLGDQEESWAILSAHLAEASMELAAKTRRQIDAERARRN